MDPLTRYRQAQRRARALFEPFTRASCPTCPTPCCRKPTWVRPVDIVLVEVLGYRLPVGRPDPTGVQTIVPVTLGAGCEGEGEPCDYLGPQGCAFPDDLRPFGCAALICEPMRRALSPEELAPVEEAVAELEAAHAELMAELHQSE